MQTPLHNRKSGGFSALLLGLAGLFLTLPVYAFTDSGPSPKRLPVRGAELLRRMHPLSDQQSRQFQPITIPGDISSQANAINNQEQVVGFWTDAQFTGHGFVYANGKLASVDYPGSTGTALFGISNNGALVGAYSDQLFNVHGFLLTNGRYTPIDFPGAAFTQPNAINDAGDVVGYYQIDNNGPFLGFLWQKGMFTTLSAPGAIDTFALSLNNRGDIVGFIFDPQNQHSFLLRKGVYTTLDPPSSTSSLASGINSSGQILIEAAFDAGPVALVLSADTYTPITIPGADVLTGGINDKGDVVGAYAYPLTGFFAFLLLR